MAINALYFDLGGVLLRTEDRSIRENFGKQFGMSYEEIDEFVFNCQSAKLASIGKITEDEHWLDVTRRLSLDASKMPWVRDTFFAGDILDQDLIGFLREQRTKIKTGLISNAWSGLRPWIIDAHFDDAFDTIVISAEFGTAKPDPKIYQFALQQLNVPASNSIFVDDVLKNVDAANGLGMKGILFKNTQQVLDEITGLYLS